MNQLELKRVIETASLAPRLNGSAGWHFVALKHVLALRAPGAGSSSVSAARRFGINCGAAVEFARLAIERLGYECVVRISPDSHDRTLVATLTIGSQYVSTPEPAVPDPGRLLAGAAMKGTSGATPKDVSDKIRAAADDRRCWTRMIGGDVVHRIGLELGPVLPPTDARPVDELGSLVLLGSDGDAAADQVRVGRAWANIVLALEGTGLILDPGSPVAEVSGASTLLSHSLNLISTPQLLFRVSPEQDGSSKATEAVPLVASLT